MSSTSARTVADFRELALALTAGANLPSKVRHFHMEQREVLQLKFNCLLGLAFSEALAGEVADQGISVCLLEPGDFRTSMSYYPRLHSIAD